MIGGIYILSYGEFYLGEEKHYGWHGILEGSKQCGHFDVYENKWRIGNIHEKE